MSRRSIYSLPSQLYLAAVTSSLEFSGALTQRFFGSYAGGASRRDTPARQAISRSSQQL